MIYVLPVKTGYRKTDKYHAYPVTGEPTKRAMNILGDYHGYINLTTTMDDPRYGWGDKILKDWAM